MRYKFSVKFYVGAVLIILSFVIGKITQAMFVLYFNDMFLRWVSIIAYFITWPMLIIGAWWVGKEYSEKIQRYFKYKFYRERTRKVKEHIKGKLRRKKK